MEIFSPVRRQESKLPSRIAEQIHTLIVERRLKEGDRLPPEGELARLLGVSRPSLREALKTLAAAEGRLLLDVVARMRAVRTEDHELVETLQRLDTELHQRIAEATHNPLLVRVMQGLLDLLSESRRRSLLIPGQGLKSIRYHEAIARAIARRDAHVAARAMRRHLEDILRAVRRQRIAPGRARTASGG